MDKTSFHFDSNNTFCITLLSNTTRHEKMLRKFDCLNLDVTMWPASTPDTLTDNFVNNLHNLQKACAQSHWNIWKYIINNNIEYALILEDDACFDKFFFTKLNKFHEEINDPEWDGIFLNASEEINHVDQWRLINEQYLTGGYILSIRGAMKLIQMYDGHIHVSDWMTSRLQLFNHCYSYFPWLIIQEGNETTIQSDVSEDHKKVIRLLGEINYSLENYDINL